jgi:putative transposase
MARPTHPITVTEEQREVFEQIVRNRKLPKSLSQRVQIVLLAVAGQSNKNLSYDLGLGEMTVGWWRKRWIEGFGELEKLTGNKLRLAISQLWADQPRCGNPGTFTAEPICQIIATAGETPPEYLSHWSRSELVREVTKRGIVEHIFASTVGRLLKSGTA